MHVVYWYIILYGSQVVIFCTKHTQHTHTPRPLSLVSCVRMGIDLLRELLLVSFRARAHLARGAASVPIIFLFYLFSLSSTSTACSVC